MATTDRPKPRRHRLRTVLLLVGLVLLAVLAAGVAFLPDLIPAETLRAEIESALAEELGRPVSVESARLSWVDGLVCTGLEIGAKPTDADARTSEPTDAANPAAEPDRPDPGTSEPELLARAEKLVVVLGLADALAAARGEDVTLDTLRVEGLELWLVKRADGEWNVADLAAAGGDEPPPPRIRSLQVADARLHVLDAASGRRLTAEDIQASVGELAATGQGYVSLSAGFPDGTPDGDPGTLLVTATLSSLDPAADPATLSGALRTEWKDVDWPSVAAVAAPVPPEASALGPTSGHVTVSFGRGAWQVDGSIETGPVALPGAGHRGPLVLPRAVVGFQAAQDGREAPLELDLVKLSAPGIDLKLAGRVDLADPAKPRPDVRLTGSVAWGPLSRSIRPVGDLAEGFERLGGRADVDIKVSGGREGYEVRGTADLKATEALLPGRLRKEAGQSMELAIRAAVPHDLASVEIERLRLAMDAASVTAQARLPLAKADGAVPAGASAAVDVQVGRIEELSELLPGLAKAVPGTDLAGPVKAELVVSPRRAETAAGGADPSAGPAGPTDPGGDSGPGWDARLRVDLAGLSLAAPGGVRKEAGTAAHLRADALIGGGGRTAELRGLHFHLADAQVVWQGTGGLRQLDHADEGLSWVGHTKGRLTIDGLGTLGSLLLPDRFTGEAGPPVDGQILLDLDAALDGNRITGSLGADMAGVAIDGGEGFRKPSGVPADLRVEGSWLVAEPNFLDASATLRVPGVVAKATAKGQVPATGRPAARGNDDLDAWIEEVARRAGVSPELVRQTASSTATVRIETRIEDVGRALALVPALAKRAKGRTEGGGTVSAEVFTSPGKATFSAAADLAAAGLDFGPDLVKPAGRALTLAVAAEAQAGRTSLGEPALDCRLEAEARLDESRARTSGRVVVAVPTDLKALASADDALTMVRHVDLETEASVVHGPSLAAAVPRLGPLYEGVSAAGPMRVRARVAGTPLAAEVGFEVEASECLVREGERVIKGAGVPASVRAAGRFGQVPGELVLERATLVFGEVKTEAAGRFLFDSPRLSAAQSPRAWTVDVKGELPDLAMLNAALPPEWRVEKPTGSVAFDVRAAGDTLGAALERCDLEFRDSGLVWLGRPVRIDGRAVYDGRVLRIGDPADGGGQLRLSAGTSNLALSGRIVEPDRAPRGTLAIRGTHVDVDELTALAEATEKRFASASKAEPDAAAAEAQAERLDRLIRRAGVAFDARIGTVAVTMPQLDDAFYELEDVEAEGRLADGRFTVGKLDYGVNNGTVTSNLEIDFRPEVPVLTVTEVRRDLEPRPNVIPIISKTFPGLECTGSVSTRETKRQRLEEGAWPVGHGETVLVEGRLVGPGAPEYVQRVFPGLKLTTYNYKKMVNRYKLEADGTVQNRMIFDGMQYDIYIFGYSRHDGKFRYELGVELGLGLKSETWTRDLDQGKVPLMIYWGEMYLDRPGYKTQEIRYVRLDELLHDVLVKRGLLVKLFERMGKKPPDIPEPPDWPDEDEGEGEE